MADSPAKGQGRIAAQRAIETDTATIAVVVIGDGDERDLTGALEAAVGVCREVAATLHLLHPDEGVRREIGLRYPAVRCMQTSPGASEAELRAAGFEACGSDVVIFARTGDLNPAGRFRALVYRSSPNEMPPGRWGSALAERGIPGALGDA